MSKIRATENTAKAVETKPVSLPDLKIRFADIVRLRQKYVGMLNQLDGQLQALDAEITKRETPKQ
jgi:hypothetical protein